MSVGIFQWPENVLIDESVEEYEYFDYSPVSETLTTLNGIGEIRFSIDSLSSFLHPAKSHLYVEGQIKRTDGIAFPNDANVTLVNNGIAHLFSEVKYSISGQRVEDVLEPGIASTMLGLLRYPDDFSKSEGLLQCWFKDSVAAVKNPGREERKKLLYHNNNDIQADQKGCFSICIPLEHLFGFCEDYNKVMYGVTHTLSSFRQNDDIAIHRQANQVGGGNADVAAKIEIQKIKWRVPQVKPSFEIANGLIGEIESKTIVQVGFKARKCDKLPVSQGTDWTWRLAVTTGAETPRFLVLGFQTGDKAVQIERADDEPSVNPSIFDHCYVNNIQVQMLGRLYPLQTETINFSYNHWALAYKNAADFRKKMDGTPGMFSHTGINPIDFQRLYPLYVFDLSNQVAKLRSGVVDMIIKVKFRRNVPANTMAYALTISDKVFSLQSDGTKMVPYIT